MNYDPLTQKQKALLATAGFTASQLIRAGFMASQLIDAGVTASQLIRAGFTASPITNLAMHIGVPQTLFPKVDCRCCLTPEFRSL